MKLKGEIIAAENCGDIVKLTLQARSEGEADWRPFLRVVIELPAYKATSRVYHLGRIVAIDARAK